MKVLILPLALAALALGGCATYKSGPTSVRDVSQYSNSATAGSVTIAAELISKPADVQAGFYVNITEKDFWPVQIVAKNNGTQRYLLLKDHFELVDASGNSVRPANVAVMIDDFEHNKMAYALLGFGIFSYMSAEDANKKMSADWTSKELPSETVLDTARSASGFLYIKMPRGVKPNGMKLNGSIENLETRAIESFTIRI